MKTIEFQLSKKSIENAIKELKEYQKSLEAKNIEFMERMGRLGVNVISQIMSGVPEEGQWDSDYRIVGNGVEIYLRGDKVLFAEFSAGITYGIPGSAYPTPAGADMGMGTYDPNSDNWKNPDGWFYRDENGKLHHSYGNRAYMPVYHASEAIILEMVHTAREVFGG